MKFFLLLRLERVQVGQSGDEIGEEEIAGDVPAILVGVVRLSLV